MRILVTAIGSVAGPFVAQRLKSLGHVVIGVNIATAHVPAAARFCDAFQSVAHSSEETRYIGDLLAVARRFDADCVLPLTDPEAYLLSRTREVFTAAGVEIACSSADSLGRVRDKLTLAVEAGGLPVAGLAVIPTHQSMAAARESHPFPIVRKPRVGRSSQGVAILTRPEPNAGGNCAGGNCEDMLYQPFIDGPVITVDALPSMACPRVELVRTSRGLGVAAGVFRDPRLRQIVAALLDHFGISSLVNIEFIRSGDEYFLMDFNLRASAGLEFSYRAGSDFLAAMFPSDAAGSRSVATLAAVDR